MCVCVFFVFVFPFLNSANMNVLGPFHAKSSKILKLFPG